MYSGSKLLVPCRKGADKPPLVTVTRSESRRDSLFAAAGGLSA